MLRPHPPLDAFRRGVFSREEALQAGWTPRSIRTQLTNGTWIELARGVYTEQARLNLADVTERHRLCALAAGLRRRVAIVGLSAAAIHGVTLLDAPRGDVQVRRLSEVDRDELSCISGVTVSSPGRTIVDCAREHGAEVGLVMADAALRTGAVDKEDMQRLVGQCRGRPGYANAEFVVAEANGLAESPFESVSRLRFIQLGLPRPELQVTIPTRDGVLYRVDFLWRAMRVIGEADGLGKYGANPGAIRAEKRRQVALEDAGYEVARWLWEEIWTRPAAVAARVQRSFELSRMRFGL